MGFVMAGRRPRRAVALRLLVLSIIVAINSGALAQEMFSDGACCPGEDFSYGDDSYGCADCVGQNQSSRDADVSCWVGAEYLRWRLDGSELPPLLTDGPANLPLDEVGQLDNPFTRILSGDETVGDDWRNGYRFYAGMWIDPCHVWSIGADYFNVGDDDYDFSAGNDPNRIVTRPFFNAETGEEDTQLVSIPNQLDGTVDVSAGDDFEGAGLTLQRCIWQRCDPCGCGPSSLVNVLGGYRHYSYDSDLVITENLTVLPGTMTPLVPGTQIFVQDQFTTRTEFHGGEFGFQGWSLQDWWWVDGLAKAAVGSHRRTVVIDGETINTVPGAGTAEFEGGLFTSEVTNIGRYRDRSLAIVPEFRLGVGALLGRGCSVRAGYNLILWNAVARAADQLPPGLEVDPRNIPPVQPGGGPEPEFAGIRGSSLVAHGFDFGIQWMY